MASLDQILDRMTERGGERLKLRVGEIPTVRAAGRDVPVQKVALSEAQVIALARELADDNDAQRLDRREPALFSYRGFDVRVSFAQSGAAVDIAPADPLALPDDVLTVPSLAMPAPPLGPAADQHENGRMAFDLDDRAAPHAAIDLDPSVLPMRPSPGQVPGSGGPEPPAAAVVGVRLPSLPPAARGTSATVTQATLPGGFLDDLRSFVETRRARYVALGALGALGVAVLGGFLWCARPVQVPNVVMADASGHPVSFDDMRGSQHRMLVVFLLPGCSMSRFAVDTLKQAYPERSEKMAFVGLFFGSQAEAQQFGKDQQVPFPLYGLKDNKDPFQLQELMKKVGTSDWMVNGIYGGTTIVLDDRNKVIFKLEKEGVRQLPEKLAALKD